MGGCVGGGRVCVCVFVCALCVGVYLPVFVLNVCLSVIQTRYACLSGNCIAFLIQHKDSFLYMCVVFSLSCAVL